MSVSSTTLARSLALLTVVLFSCWSALLLLNAHEGLQGDAFDAWSIPQEAVSLLVYVAVGALVATQRSENPIGWLLLLVGLSAAIVNLATQYAAAALVGGHGWPGGLALAVGLKGGWAPQMYLLVLVVLLFPTGSLLSHRWRAVVWLATAAIGLLFLVSHVGPLDQPFSDIENPIRFDAGPILSPLVGAPVILAIVASLLAAFACPVVRFRRAGGDEREQLKWFFVAASVLPLGIVSHVVAETFFPSVLNADERVFSAGVALLPIAIGIAILKYRLYEIDRIISRALVYGGLTIVLGAAYVGLVLAGQALFSSSAGGSNLAIAASTLAVAALFLPARSRVQRFVDRRFYRRRYDAQRTLEAFGSRLREQIELDALSESLLRAVGETMQPVSATLWLNDARRTAKPVTIP